MVKTTKVVPALNSVASRRMEIDMHTNSVPDECCALQAKTMSSAKALFIVVALQLALASLAWSQNPVPNINQPLVPQSALPGSKGFTLTVNGAGFVRHSRLMWNGKRRPTTFVSSTQLLAKINKHDLSVPATASVTVINPDPGGGTSNVDFFQITTPSSSVTLSPTQVPTDIGPRSTGIGDFNGDGKVDLVVSDSISGNVSILLGNGDGTFQPAVNYPVGEGSSFQFFQVAVADFNSDCKLDFAVSNFDGNNVSVFLGNGDGTFQAAVNYRVRTNPSWVAAGDFDADGNLDLVVSNQNCTLGGPPCGRGTVSILLGNGDGTFRPHVDYAAGTAPNDVTVGDYNGDGKLDLAVANGQGNCGACSSAFSILLGNGDGTFQKPVTTFFGINPASLVTADHNGDGKLDLAIVDNIGLLWIFLGNGDGTFQSPVEYTTDSFPFGNIGIGDFNGDGRLDLAIANGGSNDIEIFLGNGDGKFQSPIRFNTGSSPQGVVAGDFNQDGRIDLAVPNYKDNTVSVLLQ